MNRVNRSETRLAIQHIRQPAPHPMRARPAEGHAGKRSSPKSFRLAALACLGLALGAGGAIMTVSTVQAFDEFGVRDFFTQEQTRKETTQRAARVAQPAYYALASYAPARSVMLPFLRSTDDGRLAAPAVNLNPFVKTKPNKHAAAQARRNGGLIVSNDVAANTVSGAANMPRSICVRVCDGFHAPLGYLTSQADLGAHGALCKAMNPGIPVKVYRVAAGATTIDGALGPDGKTYGSLPMAYSHEKSADPTCRPKIVQAGERRVSVLRDFTLRPGDTVVLDGTARVFGGASRYPFQSADFRDFRQADGLTPAERRRIDVLIGQSFMADAKRIARRDTRLREASLSRPGKTVVDFPFDLRSGYAISNDVAFFTDGQRGPVRVISPGTFGAGH